MSRLCIRLREEDKMMLEEMTKKQEKTTTEVIRDLIQIGYDRQSVSDALKEIKVVVAGQRTASTDLGEIKRIVTLIGRALPGSAKYMS